MSPTCSERGAAVGGGDATLRCDSVSLGTCRGRVRGCGDGCSCYLV